MTYYQLDPSSAGFDCHMTFSTHAGRDYADTCDIPDDQRITIKLGATQGTASSSGNCFRT